MRDRAIGFHSGGASILTTPARLLLVLIVLLAGASSIDAQSSRAPAGVQPAADFQRQVEPIFKEHCQSCHGAASQMGGLRLDRREDALRGGNSGPVIVPGNSAGSRLIQLVAGQPKELRMPFGRDPLPDRDIAVLRTWIDAGAVWPKSPTTAVSGPEVKPKSAHWAFQPPRRPAVPQAQNASWARNEIDSFVLARLEKENIQPSPSAGKALLARRLSLDLAGLPITPGDLQDYLADSRPDAYERLVDRLLESPHYGEKWGRYWLDLARYADSEGYSRDKVRPYAWRYRDWVINAFNRDMPFDRFTVEQVAGDLLPHATTEERVATGFHRNSMMDHEAGVDLQQTVFEETLDRTNAMGAVWLGLTVGCARCHDHKYDPITQKDYYSLFAFFEHVKSEDIDAPLPGEMGPYLRARPDYLKKRDALYAQYHVRELQAWWEKKLLEASREPGKYADWDFVWTQLSVIDLNHEVVGKPPHERTPHEQEFLTDTFLRLFNFDATKKLYEENKFKELTTKLKELDAGAPKLTQALTIADRAEERKTNIRLRGDYRARGTEVLASTPAFLPPIHSTGTPDRLALARWMTSPENPLTARVMANRIWQELFGRGIVLTSENFGTQGAEPSSPELLDWLALTFREDGWSMKNLIRRIVTSATYRQSSQPRPDLAERDPNNLLLARQGRFRLPAELVRDSALAVSGLLDTRVGGPSIRPPLPAGVADLAQFKSSDFWTDSSGKDLYRRGLYIQFQRALPYPSLLNFDAPNATESCSRRERSNTPLQALNLLDDPVFFEAAMALANRILSEAPPTFDERLKYAFALALARPPSPTEKALLKKYFEHRAAEGLNGQPALAVSLAPAAEEGGNSSGGRGGNSEAAAWVGVSRVLLNLDEFITRE